MKIHQKGFTIVEILVVIAILLLLAGLISGAGQTAKLHSQKTKTKADIYSLGLALRAYEADYGGFPADGTSAVGNNSPLIALLRATTKNGPYIEIKSDDMAGGSFVDPWRNAYRYNNCTDGATFAGFGAARNPGSFDIYSFGPNGVNNNGTGDDITNW